ncbi:adenylate/guanylate cyclase domain-containing protein [Methylobacterium nodulans]|uniref:adenylate/guanylate cyclase domain-containing protein n=1 Tax=Methylobacterium nodulans TaxID=114616 RepID=UPI000681FE7F|nr:adenylate/guanylate cyclase domain-containing protein [Methylobacterium nodulans]
MQRRTRETLASVLAAGNRRRVLALRLVIFLLLLVAAQIHDGALHAGSHWFILGGYAASSVWLILAERRRDGGRLSWISTLLDAALAAYVVIEHMMAGTKGPSDAGDMVSWLPAFLLLLQTGLTLRIAQTAVFAGLVSGAWGLVLALGVVWPDLAPFAPALRLSHQTFGLLAFSAAGLFVIDGVARLRRALGEALRLEQERAQLARFVPAGIDLVTPDGHTPLRFRNAALLALDIRGFSSLTRFWGGSAVAGWLLDIRATAQGAISRQGGIVDKYIGDGVLALFLDGSPEAQARAALACAREIRRRVSEDNRRRVEQGLPALHVTAALHTGEVLVGVFDDGHRAEFTVLGPAMNALARIERRAKRENLDLAVSKRFARLLDPAAPPGRRLPRRDGEDDCPDVVALDPAPGQADPVAARQTCPS